MNIGFPIKLTPAFIMNAGALLFSVKKGYVEKESAKNNIPISIRVRIIRSFMVYYGTNVL